MKTIIKIIFFLIKIQLLFIGVGGILLAIADFCGMCFGYDFTGSSGTPVIFGGIGYLSLFLANKIKIKD